MLTVREMNNFAAFAVFAFFAFAVYKTTTEKPSYKEFLPGKRFMLIAGIAVFAAAIFLRVFRFGEIPGGLNQDGAMAAVDAYALAKHGTDRFGMPFPAHFTAWGYGQMSVLLSYITAIFYKFTDMNIITTRLPMLLVSLISLYVFYAFAKESVNKTFALAVLLLVAFNPWHIMQSRWALDCNVFPHFVLLGMYFLYKGLKNRIYLYLSMVFFGLSMFGYGTAFVSIPVLLAGLCVYLLVRKFVKLRDVFICAFVYALFSWPIYAVMIINTLKLKTISLPFVTIPFFGESRRMNDLLPFSPNIPGQLISNIKSFTDIVMLQKDDAAWNTVPGIGTLFLFVVILAIAGIAVFILQILSKNEKKLFSSASAKTAIHLNLIWLAASVFTGCIVNSVNSNRINIVFYPMLFMAAAGMYFLAETCRKQRLGIVLTALLVSASVVFSAQYFGPHGKTLRYYYNEGLDSAVEYAETGGFDHIYITDQTIYGKIPAMNEIMYMFYAKTDALYFQGKADGYSESGEKLLPYSDRYKYIEMSDSDSFNTENSVFIFYVYGDSGKLDEKKYNITIFDYYGVAVLK